MHLCNTTIQKLKITNFQLTLLKGYVMVNLITLTVGMKNVQCRITNA